MKNMAYEELLAQIVPLDLTTLTRLEADLTRIVNQRQAEKAGRRCSLMELTAQAGESLKGLDQADYWAELEKELAESRNSWADEESGLDRRNRP